MPARAPRSARLRLVGAAFSYEGSADEASFVIGPALVGLAVSVVSPTASIVGAAVLLARHIVRET